MAGLVVLTAPLKTMVPIIKVVGDFCNLRCRYCFYNTQDQSTPQRMDEELLEKFLSHYLELFPGQLLFIWHGGEPLLAGLPFFKKIIELQERHRREGQTIRNAVQTNATLVDDMWAEFFKIHDFRVGVSVDGDKESHDRFRTNLGGRGSFNAVQRGVETLRQHGVHPGFIQTLTHSNTSHAREDFNFLANILGAKSWGVNEYLDVEGVNRAMLGQTISNEELTAFLKTYVDCWLEQDDAGLKIREIENFLAGVFGKRAPGCTFNGTCTSFFCLEYDGRIYPCDRLSNREDLLFGNLTEASLLEILNGSERLAYAEGVNRIHPDCAVCEWQAACHSGCTHHRVGGISGKYYYCETRKTIFAYLKKKVETLKNRCTS